MTDLTGVAGPRATALSAERLADALALGLLGLAVLALYQSAPRDGDFWWSDAPRHALNGVFLRDFVADLPWRDPIAWATAHYIHSPALTILFYPPLFYVISAAAFALFGVSQATAVGVVALFYFAFAAGVYALARRWAGRGAALGAALLLAGAPEIALWGRQVMLEIPAFAFLVWSIWLLCRHLDDGRPAPLYAATGLMLCALYVKQAVIFMAPVLLLLMLLYRGRSLFRDRHVAIALALAVIGLVPLLVLTVAFGQANLQSVAGIEDAVVSRATLAGWLWYLRRLPEQLSWAVPAAAAAWVTGAALRRDWRLPRADMAFLAAWFGIGYLFYSAIDLKEARHSVFLLFPVVLAAVLLVQQVLAPRSAAAVSVLAGLAMLAATLAWHPVPRVGGYREAADLIAAAAPAGSVVLFSGQRDGSFIFNLRTHADRSDLTVLRADKLLLRIAVRQELGVEAKDYSEAEIADLLDRYRVRYVVAQTDFWTDLAPMARLQQVLQSDRFEPVARIAVDSNIPHPDSELVIYRNLAPIADGSPLITLELPIIGRQIEGKLP